MPGSAPQPGEKERTAGNPWAPADLEAEWWRGETDSYPTVAPRPAAATDAEQPAASTGPADTPTPEPAEMSAPEPAAPTGPADTPTPEPAEMSAPGPADTPTPEPAASTGPADTPTPEPAASTGPAADRAAVPEPEATPDDPDETWATVVPEVMILPEPTRDRDRPTALLAHGAVPGQPEPSDPVRAQRPDPPVRQPRQLSAAREQLIEQSPFWLATTETQHDGKDQPANGGSRLGVPPRGRQRPRAPRTPALGLAGLLFLGLLATFFAWVSAEPIWLAVGHSNSGTATVARCAGGGVTQRCVGTFTAAGNAFRQENVALLGVPDGQRHNGSTVAARMVARHSNQAYVGATGLMLHLRWTVGLLLVLGCGQAIATATGARRLENSRTRRRAVLLSLAGPVAMLAGFLAVTY